MGQMEKRHERKAGSKFLLLALLNKRLVRHYSFLAILLLIPMLSVGLHLAAKEESGFLHIVLCQEEAEDESSGAILKRLAEEKGILRYTVVETPEEARAMVQRKKADAAWMFHGDAKRQIEKNTSFRYPVRPVVTVVQREDTVYLQLAREKLFGAMYPWLSKSLYDNVCLEWMEVSADALQKEYDPDAASESMFLYEYGGGLQKGSSQSHEKMQGAYLLSPLRGLLGLLVLLGGFAGVLFYQEDQKRNLFDVLPSGRRWWFPYLYLFPPVGNVAAAALIACYGAGIWTGWWREVLWMTLYGILCVLFCTLLRRLFKTQQRLAAAVPILLFTMLIVCPVFISLTWLRPFRRLFPLYYYLRAVYRPDVLWEMTGYAGILCAGNALMARLAEGKGTKN